MQYLNWRWTFVAISLLGVVWAGVFWRWFRDTPHEHPRVNDAELRRLPKVGEATAGEAATPWRELLTSLNLWLLCPQYCCQGFFFYFLVNWLPTFLREGRGMPAKHSALFSGLPMFLGGIGVCWAACCCGG